MRCRPKSSLRCQSRWRLSRREGQPESAHYEIGHGDPLCGSAVDTAVKSSALRNDAEQSASTTSQNRIPLPRRDGFFDRGRCSPASSCGPRCRSGFSLSPLTTASVSASSAVGEEPERRNSSSDGLRDGGALVTIVDASEDMVGPRSRW